MSGTGMNQKDFCTKHCTISGNQYEERRGTDVPVPGELKNSGLGVKSTEV